MKRKIKQLLKEREDVAEQLRSLQQKVIDLTMEIKRTCEHEEVVKRKQYIEGSYYDRSETITWDECVHCGEKFNKKSTLGYFA